MHVRRVVRDIGVIDIDIGRLVGRRCNHRGLITGMTCGHCVASVTEELSELDSVDAVDVDLNVGGASRVRVSASVPLDVEKVRAAVSEAGYELVDASA